MSLPKNYCRACGGTRWYQIDCKGCKSTGRVSDKQHAVCAGRGLINLKCKACGGTGVQK